MNLELFHFVRPWWLLGFCVVLWVALVLWRRSKQQQGWYQVVAPHLSTLLVADKNRQRSSMVGWLLPLALSSLVLGLAGPTWQKKPQPVFQLDAGQVIVLDVSQSMLATDIAPNRLTQMRFKAMALANEQLDGETGLIAYAGDAYVISPLTTDSRSLSNLIRALRPELMPVQGSYPLAALELADRLLREAGYAEGDIYWFTDGIDTRDQQELTTFVRNHPHRIAILGLGTEQGAPIQLANGNLLRDAAGDVVVPKMLASRLERLAELSNGRFSAWRQDQQDLEFLSSMPPLNREGSESEDQRGDAWVDQGPWLIGLAVLLVLPLVRRNAFHFALVLLLGHLALFTPPSAHAQATSNDQGLAWHEQLWQTPYQQTDQALRAEDYERAKRIAEDPWQRGTANYAQGNYEQALQDFSQVDNAQGYYNQGNALMQLERFDEAANVYQEALERDPALTEAQENLALAKQLAAAQQEQEQQQQGQGEGQQQQEGQQQGEQRSDAQSEQQPAEQSGTEGEAQQQEQGAEPQAEAPPQPQEAGTESNSTEAEGEAADPQAMPSADQLSEEQRQQMENWLNRIEDDPAILLQRKMELEARRRGRERLPQGVDKQW
ncbi:VWA domain-containing protein [Pseudidiomarina homiensis]|uniref:VWFA domain-containing protein n=1 Tax=Pseudidiomarina homiensis TaxID=364198 RepID=A0A432Y5B4_9GAMM|nr:VWA domain-containing protein [Pseudidiomarina homiensis]RUO56081.1 hypothetical protein CWI70_04765 [Pseudidiomarina homiensis]